MNMRLRCAFQHIVRIIPTLKVFQVAALAAIFVSANAAQAVETLAYSFEGDLQGFEPNPAPPINLMTLTQDTIGATEGTHSLKIVYDSAALSTAHSPRRLTRWFWGIHRAWTTSSSI